VSTQEPAQVVKAHVAEHMPELQNGVVPEHAFPHMPQFALLVARSTQDPEQVAGVVPVHIGVPPPLPA